MTQISKRRADIALHQCPHIACLSEVEGRVIVVKTNSSFDMRFCMNGHDREAVVVLKILSSAGLVTIQVNRYALLIATQCK